MIASSLSHILVNVLLNEPKIERFAYTEFKNRCNRECSSFLTIHSFNKRRGKKTHSRWVNTGIDHFHKDWDSRDEIASHFPMSQCNTNEITANRNWQLECNHLTDHSLPAIISVVYLSIENCLDEFWGREHQHTHKHTSKCINRQTGERVGEYELCFNRLNVYIFLCRGE